MPPQRATPPRRRAGGDGAAIDRQTDRLDRTEAAIKWIQTLGVQFKRIAAMRAEIDRLRAKKNGRQHPSRSFRPALKALVRTVSPMSDNDSSTSSTASTPPGPRKPGRRKGR